MKRIGYLLVPSLVVLAVIGIIVGVNTAGAVNTNADYSATPPFSATAVTPNVLIMLDNSGSMGYRAVCDNTTNDFFTVTSIKRGGAGNKTATVTYAQAHGWTPATMPATITVTGATAGAGSGPYNVAGAVPTYINPTQISYLMAVAPTNATAAGNPQLIDAGPGLRTGLPAPNVYGQCPTSTALYPLGTPDGAPFRETVTFTGLFDALSCYTYSTANTRFDVTSTKATLTAPCGATEWDGNLLNWATFRRQDALKKALIGADCVVARLADGSCPPSGAPALITQKGADGSLSGCCDNEATAIVPLNGCGTGCGDHKAKGRVPTAIQTLVSAQAGPPQGLVFHLLATTAMTSGGFCVGTDNVTGPSSAAAACGIVGAGTPPGTGEFLIHMSAAIEQTGLIHDLGDKARFGLLEFRNSGDGGKVLVPIGSIQSVPYDATTISNYTSNQAAMIGAIDGTVAATGTPLSETLYTGIKYIAQLTQPFGAASYLYPIAFAGSGGPAFGAASTKGGIGSTERNLLAVGDVCPGGLGYIAGACARDPYFFGTNPVWVASPNPKQVPCCKTFILFLTDGEPNSDDNAELDRFLYPAATETALHGPTCTGDYAGAPASLTASAADQAAYVAASGCFTSQSVDPLNTGVTNTINPLTLLDKHKTDYTGASPDRNHYLDEIAYWGHTTDLRQATVTYPNGATEAGHDLSGFQNVTIYPVFAFGNISGREILMQAAKQGGFNDQNGNNLPDLQAEWDQVDNVTGLPVPDGVPDTFFESQNAFDIRDKLLTAITAILQKAAAGTAVSVLATSSTGVGAAYQAFFFPTTFVTIGASINQVTWTGYTQSLFVDTFGNLREDYSAAGCTGAPDGQLILTHDCIIKVRLDTTLGSPTYGQVLIDRYKDDGTAPGSTAGDGIADTAVPFQTVTLTTGGVSNLQPVWEAGRQLALLDPGANCEGSNTWPKAGNMTASGRTCRRILTWMDLSNGGGVGPGPETVEFGTANAFTLCPYLGGALVADCNSAIVADQTAALNEATGIINFVRGCEPAVCAEQASLRNRIMNVLSNGGAQVQKVWKLGDIIDSTPVTVGAPLERYDIIYGDATYSAFFARYKDRRQVTYVGANDGMLHAFNAGFFQLGNVTGSPDPVQARFTTTPKQPASASDCAALPCDASAPQYLPRGDAPALGAELWAYVPQDLLPQLRWLTTATYAHMYFVDLKPKVTDVRIFPNDADHPGGWGTILIGGFRLGGSCTNCSAGKGTPRMVQADFNYNGTITDTGNGVSGSDYRVFLSSYFVLDITNPEKEPTLLWTFRDQRLGLTTAAPAVLRVKGTNAVGEGNTGATGEKWYAVFGTGPTHTDAFSNQAAQIFVVDLAAGPAYSDINRTSGTVNGRTCTPVVNPGAAQLGPCIAANTAVAGGQTRVFNTSIANSFMTNMLTVDYQLDDRVDAVYAGSIICNGAIAPTGCAGAGPVWKGAMWRLTTNGGDTNPDTWGVSPGTTGSPFGATGAGLGPAFQCPGAGSNCPSPLVSAYSYSTPQATTCTGGDGVHCAVGPISVSSVASDDSNNLWVYFGEGRFFSSTDLTNVDIMHFFGVKDSFVTTGAPAQTTERNNLFNSSNVVACASCSTPTANVSQTGSTTVFGTGFSSGAGNLLNAVQNSDGWFTTFNDPTAPFQTPSRSAMTAGERNLSPAIVLGGTLFFTTFTPTGDMCVSSGTGLLYAVFYQTGGPYISSALGTSVRGGNTLVNKSLLIGQGMPSQASVQLGAQGTGVAGSSSGSGCVGRATIYIQSSTGVLGQTCGSTALSAWSRLISWREL